MALHTSLHTSLYPALRTRPAVHTSLHTSRPAPLRRYVMGWDSGTWVDSKGNAASGLSFKQVRRRSALESSPASAPYLPACMDLHLHLPCIFKGGIFPRELPCTPPLHLPSTPPACHPYISKRVLPSSHLSPLFTPSLSHTFLFFIGPLRVYHCERRHQLQLGVHLELYRPDAVQQLQHVHGVRRHTSMQ